MDSKFYLAKKIDEPNKIVIPEDICKKYGLNTDTVIAFYLKEDGFFIKPLSQEDTEKTDL